MMKKWVTHVFGGLLAVTAVVACDEWTLWDDMFKRSSVGPTNRGWTGGDGVFSAALPNNREFWIFGDTYMTSWSAEGYRGNNPLGQAIFGNTIAVQNDRANPSAASINFYSRGPDNNCVNTSIANITNVPGPASGTYRQYFNHTMLGLSAPPVCRFLWPSGSECLNCDNATNARLLMSFYEWEKCTVGTAGCSIIGTKYTGNVIARIKNIQNSPIAAPPNHWQPDGASLYIPRSGNDAITWGVAFLKDTDNNIYIYGHEPPTNRLFVARSSEANVLSSGNWFYWRTSGGNGVWSQNGALPLRQVADQVGLKGVGALSVDRVTRNGTSAYLLVHSRPALNHHVYVRTTTSVNGGSTAATWSTPDTTTPRIDVSTIDSSAGWAILDLINRGKCEPIYTGTSLAPDWREVCTTTPCPNPAPVCGLTYQGQAHYETASNDGSGTLGIPVSYIVPKGPNPFYNPSQPEDPFINTPVGGHDAQFYRPKFTALDLTKMKPWCSTNCWEGIVKEWSTRQIGSTETTFVEDLQAAAATKIWAQLTRISGSANMMIEFWQGFTFLSSTNCTVSAPLVTCDNISKPAGASWAFIHVTGVATDQFKLRVHHAGTY